MTFGQRLKDYRKREGWTQQELADILGISTQAISRWETDTGMPDISQIVPLASALNVSTDLLLGVVNKNVDKEFETIYQKCMEIETRNPFQWPPHPSDAETGFRLMYDYFLSHPTNPRAAKYLLDLSELYWGKLNSFDEVQSIKECERFANCIYRFSDDSDLHAEANFLLASVYMRSGEKRSAYEALMRIPFQYGDRAYWSAEVAKLDGDDANVEMFSKQSFSYRARFMQKSLQLVSSLHSDDLSKQIEYEEYMLRILDAFLSGGDYLPLQQVYQKLRLLSGLIKKYLMLQNYNQATEYFNALLHLSQQFIDFAIGGSKGTCLMLLDEGLEKYAKEDRLEYQTEMVYDCLSATIKDCEGIWDDGIQNCVVRAFDIINR